MALVATRVLIIIRQQSLAVTLKRTLEQSGAFEVSSFTSVDTAVDYLRQRPHDVALVDMTLPDLPKHNIVLRLRAVQPDIAIIVTPNIPEAAAVAHDLDLQDIVDVPGSTRELIPIIERAVARMRDTLPDTAEAPAVSEDSETLVILPPNADVPPINGPAFSDLDSVVENMGGLEIPGEETIDLDDTPASGSGRPPLPFEVILADHLSRELPASPSRTGARKPPPEHEEALFSQLAAEEPPVPALEESGTVRDLMIGVSDTNLGEVMAIMRGADGLTVSDDTSVSIPGEDVAPDDKSLAQLVLEAALDESTPLENFSVADLLTNIEAQLPPHHRAVSPLPSWFQESDRYVREPDFLPEMDQVGEYTSQTTQPSSMQEFEQHPEQLETDRLELKPRSRSVPMPEPPEMLPEIPPEIEGSVNEIDEDGDTVRGEPVQSEPVVEAMPPEWTADTMHASEIEELAADFERLKQPEMASSSVPQSGEDIEPEPEVIEKIDSDKSDDPYIAQLALHLTQASLDLTAQATLLTRQGEMIAYAGSLPREEIEGLDEVFANDWDANPNQARIRFITLPSSGQDYMLYSRRTVGDFTLSMIFASAMPLRVIRRQSDRLTQALASVPEMPVEVSAPPAVPEMEQIELAQAVPEPSAPALPEAAGPLVAFTYVWLVRDPEQLLSGDVAHAIGSELESYLEGRAWSVESVHIQEDYVYVVVDAPADLLPHEVIRDLMRLSAEIAHREDSSFDPETLWSDSYLVEIPGRELTPEEIQQFVNFARKA